MSQTAELLEAIRAEAKPGIWTTGVNLARQGAVALQKKGPDEIELLDLRAELLIAEARFPTPLHRFHAVPWPLL